MTVIAKHLALVLFASVFLLPFGCGPAEGDVQTRSQVVMDSNNLKMMGLAVHNFHDTFGYIPTGYFSRDGKPLLSWRVAILPFIEQEQLWRQFKLDEPWDSPNNLPLLDKMPREFRVNGVSNETDTVTHYRIFVADPELKPAPVGKTRKAGNGMGLTFGAVTDGLSNTLFIVQAEDAVPWTKPDELLYEADKPLPKLGKFTRGGSQAMMLDASIRFLPGKLSESTLRNLICANDNKPIDLSELNDR